MTNEELRKQNNAKIQFGTAGIGISSLLKMAEGNPGFKAKVAQDEVIIERPHSAPTELQMAIRESLMSVDELHKRVWG